MTTTEEDTTVPPVAGRLYRLYTQNTYVRQGQLAEFVKKQKRHCQLHGDYIGDELLFVKVKESGKRSVMFALPPESILRAEPASEPSPPSPAPAVRRAETEHE